MFSIEDIILVVSTITLIHIVFGIMVGALMPLKLKEPIISYKSLTSFCVDEDDGAKAGLLYILNLYVYLATITHVPVVMMRRRIQGDNHEK